MNNNVPQMNVNEACLLDFLVDAPKKTSRTSLSRPLVSELEALKPIYRKKQFVSFPMSILLQKLEQLLH